MSKGTETLSTKPSLYEKTRKAVTRAGVFMGGLALTACGGGESTKTVDAAPVTPSATSSVSPNVEPVTESTPEATETKTPQQLERESMTYGTKADYFIDPEWYAIVEANGGIGGPEEDALINREYLAEVIQNLLDNQTVAIETGNPDAIIATYSQDTPGDYGNMSGSVGSLQSQAEYRKTLTENDPSLPVGSMELRSILGVSPYVEDKNMVDVSILFNRVDYNVDPQGEVLRTISQEEYNWTIRHDSDVSGWSDGGYRANWGIDGEMFVDSNNVTE